MLKKEIISYGKKMLDDKLVASSWGNISARDEGRIYLTPSGMEYDSLLEKDIVVVDRAGLLLEGERRPTSEKKMHLAIYEAREDVKAIVHTHSIFSSAFAVARQTIPAILEDLVQIVGGEVPIADYKLPGTEDLAKEVVKTLADKNAVLLANHGLIGVGENLKEAYKACLLVEKAAHIYIASSNIGKPFVLSEDDVKLMHRMYINEYGQDKE